MNKNLILIGVGSLIAAYFAGRYSAPEKIKIETVTVTKEVIVQDESKRVDQVQRIVETTRKDGRPLKTTVIQTVEASERTTAQESEHSSKESKEIENRRGIAVGLIAGLPLAEIARGPVYGAAVAIPIKLPLLPEAFIGPVFLASPNLFLGVQGGVRF